MNLSPLAEHIVLVRTSVSGYIDEFQIHTDLFGPRVMTDLTRSDIGHAHHAYFDIYFMSLSLVRELKKDHVNSCGTIRKKIIGIPNDLKIDKTMERSYSE
ncbi:hypothetical protein JTB14_008612 [Gonioctena quinquepunctata]|nr:hypothetical protein JTB14_008612 [Gonioctena quinquepunctata]